MSKKQFQVPARTRARDWLSFTVLTLSVATALVAMLIPIYSDEIAIQMVRARFFIEGGALLNLLPQCRPLLGSIPASWYPGAVFNAILYSGASDLGLRARGGAIGAAWLSLLWIWAGRHSQTLLPRPRFQALVLSINMLGVLPFLLVLARSEQLLVLALVGYCMLALFWPAKASDSMAMNGLKAALLFLMSSVFLLAHPKALFFAPVMLVSTWLVFRGAGKLWASGVILATVFAIFQSFQYAQAIGNCPSAPAMAKVLAQHTLDFRLLTTDTSAFLKIALHNLAASLGLILDRVGVSLVSQSNWLPPVHDEWMGPWLEGFGKLLKASLYVLTLVLLLATILRFALQVSKRRVDNELLLGIALVAGLVLHGVVYNSNAWHFYVPGFIVPAFVVLLLLVLRTPSVAAGWMVRASGVVSLYWIVLAIVSMGVLLAVQAPRLLQISRTGDYVIAEQLLSTPAFVREEERARLSALAKRCNIKDGDERLVLDGPAYFLFQSGRQPINVWYVSDFAFGMDIGAQLPQFLKKIDSGGVVSRCQYLPKALRDKAIVSDQMCCVSKSDL